jgi:predicted nucleic acid-binding protein
VTSVDVTLDACVLYPATLRDTLLRLAEAGFYRPHWSAQVLDEVARNLVSNRAVSKAQAQSLIEAIADAFPEAMVTGYESLIPAMTNDEKDRHVLAAAVKSRSQTLVTSNLKDFPVEALEPFAIDPRSPDQFLLYQSDLSPSTIMMILRQQAADKRRPPFTVEDILNSLARTAPSFADAMRVLFGYLPSAPLMLPADVPVLADEVAAARRALEEQGS